MCYTKHMQGLGMEIKLTTLQATAALAHSPRHLKGTSVQGKGAKIVALIFDGVSCASLFDGVSRASLVDGVGRITSYFLGHRPLS